MKLFLFYSCVFNTVLKINLPILYLTPTWLYHCLLLLWIPDSHHICFAEGRKDKWHLWSHNIWQYLSQFKQDFRLVFCLLLCLLKQRFLASSTSRSCIANCFSLKKKRKESKQSIYKNKYKGCRCMILAVYTCTYTMCIFKSSESQLIFLAVFLLTFFLKLFW